MNASNRTRYTRHFYIACLLARSAAFAFLVGYALLAPERFTADLTAAPLQITPLTVVWLLLMLSMLFRFSPSRFESLGCQKEFRRRFSPTGTSVSPEETKKADRGALWVLLSWLALNGLFYAGYAFGALGKSFMVCLAGFYGVCDIICILFFCPFQAWMMRNRCCTTCRIFNWDYILMCTPLMVLKGPLVLSACILSVILLLRWEITHYRHPHRFYESSNRSMRCGECQEHLCKYKRALQRAAKRSGSQTSSKS